MGSELLREPSRTFICAECGIKKSIPYGYTKADYVYKISKPGSHKETCWMLCGWTCYKRFKGKLARERLKSSKVLAGYSAEEAEKWLEWAGEPTTDAVKPKTKRGRPKGAKNKAVTCEVKLRECLEDVKELFMAGVPWADIREEMLLTKWGADAVRQTYFKIMREEAANE